MDTNTATITITVSITSPHQLTGKGQFKLTVKEKHLPYINVESLAVECGKAFEQARTEYYKKNEEA